MNSLHSPPCGQSWICTVEPIQSAAAHFTVVSSLI